MEEREREPYPRSKGSGTKPIHKRPKGNGRFLDPVSVCSRQECLVRNKDKREKSHKLDVAYK